MKILKFFGLLLLACLSFVFLTGIVFYGLQVSNDLRNMPSDFGNLLGFAIFFASIIFFWASLWVIAHRFWINFKKLASSV